MFPFFEVTKMTWCLVKTRQKLHRQRSELIYFISSAVIQKRRQLLSVVGPWATLDPAEPVLGRPPPVMLIWVSNNVPMKPSVVICNGVWKMLNHCWLDSPQTSSYWFRLCCWASCEHLFWVSDASAPRLGRTSVNPCLLLTQKLQYNASRPAFIYFQSVVSSWVQCTDQNVHQYPFHVAFFKGSGRGF